MCGANQACVVYDGLFANAGSTRPGRRLRPVDRSIEFVADERCEGGAVGHVEAVEDPAARVHEPQRALHVGALVLDADE